MEADDQGLVSQEVQCGLVVRRPTEPLRTLLSDRWSHGATAAGHSSGRRVYYRRLEIQRILGLLATGRIYYTVVCIQCFGRVEGSVDERLNGELQA